jgi:hypothetical protein
MNRSIAFLALGFGTLFTLWIFSAKADEQKPPSPEQQQKERVERFHAGLLQQQKFSPNWYSPEGKILDKTTRTGFKRPIGIDDESWELLQLMRELIFQANQPIKFYAQVVDQNGIPIAQAKLELQLTGTDTKKVLEKYPHMNQGEEQITWTNILYSNAKGWIQLQEAAGHYLRICKLSKDGYSPRIDLGEIEYATNCVTQLQHTRIISEPIDTNALNPNKGFTFVLKKQPSLH